MHQENLDLLVHQVLQVLLVPKGNKVIEELKEKKDYVVKMALLEVQAYLDQVDLQDQEERMDHQVQQVKQVLQDQLDLLVKVAQPVLQDLLVHEVSVVKPDLLE